SIIREIIYAKALKSSRNHRLAHSDITDYHWRFFAASCQCRRLIQSIASATSPVSYALALRPLCYFDGLLAKAHSSRWPTPPMERDHYNAFYALTLLFDCTLCFI